MFSEYDKKNVELMPDIEKLVDFLDGEIVEIHHVGASNDYSSVRDGATIRAGYTATSFVTTDKGTLYWFKVGVVTASDDDTKLGLDWIYVLDCNVSDAYSTAWGEWNNRRINGAKEKELQRPDNIEVCVNY